MTQWITEFILFFKDLSYAGVVIALSFEFVPAELVLPLAGYWVYLGDMNLILTIIAGTVGGTFGPLTLYALGRFGGRPLVEKYGKYFLIRTHHLEASDRFFEKYGSGVAFDWALRARGKNFDLYTLRCYQNECFQIQSVYLPSYAAHYIALCIPRL